MDGQSPVPRRCRVLFLLRTLSPGTGGTAEPARSTRRTIGGVGAMVAALAYMLSPYVLQNEARQSALLLPWVGLPWMIGLTARALRRGGWRHAALFALVVALVGSTNAVALILVGVGPALWVVWELVVGPGAMAPGPVDGAQDRAFSARRCRCGGPSGLAVEGAYGMDILRYTESIPTVARTSLASETLRGLGYWFFYGVDKMGLYLPMAGPYMTSLWLVAVSFAVPATAFLAAFVLRWRRARLLRRAGRGGHDPLRRRPSALEPLAPGDTREDGRHGVDGGIGAAQHQPGHAPRRAGNRGAPRCRRRRAPAALEDRRAWSSAAAATGLVAADLPALWTGQFVAANLSRPEQIPSYWSQAARLSRRPSRGGVRHAWSSSPGSTSPRTAGARPSSRCSPGS